MDIQQEQEIILETATEKILKLCKAAKNAGAYGAKQMGAGGGRLYARDRSWKARGSCSSY